MCEVKGENSGGCSGVWMALRVGKLEENQLGVLKALSAGKWKVDTVWCMEGISYVHDVGMTLNQWGRAPNQ